MHTHTVERIGDPDIHAVETGPRDARPILFVHGYSQHHLSWREQLRSSLADDYRLVAMDLRGHGESETPSSPGAYGDSEAWADDVAAVIDALDLEDVCLVGWSYGSLVALDYCAVHGTDRLAGLALVGTVCGIGTERATEWLHDDYLDLFPDLVSTDAETSAAALAEFADLCVRGPLDTEARYLTVGYGAVVPPFVRDGMRDRSVSHLDLFPELSVPALLVHGAHDQVVSPEAPRAAADRLPDAEISVYPNSGHSPFYENPPRFESDLRGLLDSLS